MTEIVIWLLSLLFVKNVITMLLLCNAERVLLPPHNVTQIENGSYTVFDHSTYFEPSESDLVIYVAYNDRIYSNSGPQENGNIHVNYTIHCPSLNSQSSVLSLRCENMQIMLIGHNDLHGGTLKFILRHLYDFNFRKELGRIEIQVTGEC